MDILVAGDLLRDGLLSYQLGISPPVTQPLAGPALQRLLERAADWAEYEEAAPEAEGEDEDELMALVEFSPAACAFAVRLDRGKEPSKLEALLELCSKLVAPLVGLEGRDRLGETGPTPTPQGIFDNYRAAVQRLCQRGRNSESFSVRAALRRAFRESRSDTALHLLFLAFLYWYSLLRKQGLEVHGVGLKRPAAKTKKPTTATTKSAPISSSLVANFPTGRAGKEEEEEEQREASLTVRAPAPAPAPVLVAPVVPPPLVQRISFRDLGVTPTVSARNRIEPELSPPASPARPASLPPPISPRKIISSITASPPTAPPSPVRSPRSLIASLTGTVDLTGDSSPSPPSSPLGAPYSPPSPYVPSPPRSPPPPPPPSSPPRFSDAWQQRYGIQLAPDSLLLVRARQDTSTVISALEAVLDNAEAAAQQALEAIRAYAGQRDELLLRGGATRDNLLLLEREARRKFEAGMFALMGFVRRPEVLALTPTLLERALAARSLLFVTYESMFSQ
jgi:hypothetical protein